MKEKKENSRRQFLINSSLTALSLGLLPAVSKAMTPDANANDSAPPCDPTTNDYYGQGPFYTPDAPVINEGQLADADEAGTRIRISGRVLNLDCSEAIPNAIIDIWHADDAGAYDNEAYHLRGKIESNAQGFYMFETIKPGWYLNGAEFRPSHVHIKVTPHGFGTLTTQLYFEGDPYIANDAAASITSGTFDASNRIIPLVEAVDTVQEGTWDIIVDGDGVQLGVNDLHLEKGIIYSASPNPFTDRVVIKYGVFLNSKVSLDVFNMQGQQVASLEQKEMQAEKYEAVWEPSAYLPGGHYFVALKVNDLQVHYLKIIRK